jgi:uncharacterized iron-regulated membrane protein
LNPKGEVDMADARRFSLRPSGLVVGIILVILAVAGTIYSLFGPV